MAKPKRISKEDIVNAALALVRRRGASALCARELAAELGCSTQPIFSSFASMEEVRAATLAAGYVFYGSFLADAIARKQYPPYKASGLAYIQFATEEKELFRWLYMRDSSSEPSTDADSFFTESIERIAQATGFDTEIAARLHVEMWAFVHGFATMHATGFYRWDSELISAMATDVYNALVQKFQKEKANGNH